MIERTFPLHALPAFEAASRHGSFKAAAAELHLTPSAISHQIKQLEAALGIALFRRLPRGLELTAAGQRYAEATRTTLERLHAEGDAIVGRAPRMQLRLSMPAFVAEALALPALSAFRSEHADIELSITTGLQLADLEGGEADAAIRIGRGTWKSVTSTKLSDCYGSVVAVPTLAAEVEERSRAGTLPVICLSSLREHTRQILAALGLHAGPRHVLWLDNYVSVVQAARHGLGVAVVLTPDRTPLAPPGLSVLLPRPCSMGFGMYFACRAQDADREEIVALRAWAQRHLTPHPWLLA